MAATPPRPASPAPVPISKSAHNLQISPNLEALLQHDELTRRNSNSPHTSPSSGVPFSLPPPPPRGAKNRRRGQEATKDGQRSKSSTVDLWNSTDGRSGSLAPNPYLNPAPVLNQDFGADSRPHSPMTPQVTAEDVSTPRLAVMPLPIEHKSDASVETRGRPCASDRPSKPLHKVEKMLWMGRDSLSLFSGSANATRRNDSDRRSNSDPAVQDGQMMPVTLAPDTATVSSPKSATSYFHQSPYAETASIRSHPTRSESGSVTEFSTRPPAHLLPRPSLPSISMTHSSSRTQSVDSVIGNDYLSFIDFLSPSTSDECNVQDKPKETRPSRRHPQSIYIPPPSVRSSLRHSHSSTSLASMRFAPPSPTAVPPRKPAPAETSSRTSSSSISLSSMIFAPPSPTIERVSSRLQPCSDPPSPYSPLEFAEPPCSPKQVVDSPSRTVAPEPTSERGRKFKPKKRSQSSSPYLVHTPVSPLPPTTNQLDANERADRIWRNRKLARVFGRTPGAEESLTDVDEPRAAKKSHSPSLAALLTKQKNHRHAVSMTVSVKTTGLKAEPSTPWRTDDLWSPDGRRHSTPLATGFTLYVDDEEDGATPKRTLRSRNRADSPDAASTRSFIDLSDDDASDLSAHQPRHRHLHHSTSTPSFVESLDSEMLAEIERRRKREKLARLHRFLGSRVPPEVISGNVFGPPLPPLAVPGEFARDPFLRECKTAHPGGFDRGREELDEREKALNVRRAQKMERVFGTPPPQVLFHTRQNRPTVPASQPASPSGVNPYVLTLDIPSSRNQNQSAYTGKAPRRPGPSDSSRCLLPNKGDAQSSPSSFAESFADSFAESLSGYQQVLAQSSVYLNFQHSLNSLVDIIDRDDRKSLVELHRFLHGEADESPSDEEVAVNPRRLSIAASLKSERRHSLPSSASMTSLSSELYASPQTSRFQIRRRQAAKLTNFFGVDYRELIRDVLESIEKGVEEERKEGTLQPQEVELLMHRVRSLRSIKDPLRS